MISFVELSKLDLPSCTHTNCLVLFSGTSDTGNSLRNNFNSPATAAMSPSSNKLASPWRSKSNFNLSIILELPLTLNIPSWSKPVQIDMIFFLNHYLMEAIMFYYYYNMALTKDLYSRKDMNLVRFNIDCM